MKSIKLKCTSSTMKLFFEANKLYKGRIDDGGNISVQFAPKHWHVLDKMTAHGEDSLGNPLNATFVELKTKTLKCTGLDHSQPMKKSFKVGKRYQVESGRALGAVAGYIFDEDGCRWNLFRADVGFIIADGTTFEAKYL